jgi:hypothetical protein
MVVHFGITGKVWFGSAYLDADLLARGLYLLQIMGHDPFRHFTVPLPTAVTPLDTYTSPTDGKAIDEFERQMFVKDKNLG